MLYRYQTTGRDAGFVTLCSPLRKPLWCLATGTKMEDNRICLALSSIVGVSALKVPVSESNTAQ